MTLLIFRMKEYGVAQWLGQLPHSEKVMCLILIVGLWDYMWGFACPHCYWWVLSGFLNFLPQSKNVCVR